MACTAVCEISCYFELRSGSFIAVQIEHALRMWKTGAKVADDFKADLKHQTIYQALEKTWEECALVRGATYMDNILHSLSDDIRYVLAHTSCPILY